MKYLHAYSCLAAPRYAQDSGNSAEGFSAMQEVNTGLCTKESAVGEIHTAEARGDVHA